MVAWRAERRAELSVLPAEVQQSAHLYRNGEVSWPNEDAEAAVDALADAGYLILGLDARKHFPDGGIQEVPISDYGVALRHTPERGLHNADAPSVEPSVDTRREAAREDLVFARNEGEYVLITYSPPGGDDAKHALVDGRQH